MLNPIRRQKDSGYCGNCEFPNCPNKVISKKRNFKYCIMHTVDRKTNPEKFYAMLKNKPRPHFLPQLKQGDSNARNLVEKIHGNVYF